MKRSESQGGRGMIGLSSLANNWGLHLKSLSRRLQVDNLDGGRQQSKKEKSWRTTTSGWGSELDLRMRTIASRGSTCKGRKVKSTGCDIVWADQLHGKSSSNLPRIFRVVRGHIEDVEETLLGESQKTSCWDNLKMADRLIWGLIRTIFKKRRDITVAFAVRNVKVAVLVETNLEEVSDIEFVVHANDLGPCFCQKPSIGK